MPTEDLLCPSLYKIWSQQKCLIARFTCWYFERSLHVILKRKGTVVPVAQPTPVIWAIQFWEKKTHANAYLWLLYLYLLCIKISLFEQEGRSLQFGCRNSKRDLSGLIAFPLRNEFVINDATHSANNQTDNQFL
jgi:hypothetical protein